MVCDDSKLADDGHGEGTVYTKFSLQEPITNSGFTHPSSSPSYYSTKWRMGGTGTCEGVQPPEGVSHLERSLEKFSAMVVEIAGVPRLRMSHRDTDVSLTAAHRKFSMCEMALQPPLVSKPRRYSQMTWEEEASAP